ncbi:TNF receptor-associated factor 5 isoform X1 [Microcaecilia unicolor]|uniref:TNF receptor-associated factor n=1 Tax=Microcaecilia unicolor TaxID=1415580 RepID=A0A6P7XDB1_9AMPH|nr:TNF receptor-associated factor 5 isoform X1 [Microcaecilia unicolor]
MASVASEEDSGGSDPFTCTNSTGASLEFEPNIEYVFVEKLEERYKCAECSLVLHNPHQTGCGHRFCQNCILTLRKIHDEPTCPIDHEIINPHEVFKDNCCKREVLNLQVICKNMPDCSTKVTLGRYQEHLKQCLLETVECSNDGCHDVMLRKALKDHLQYECKFREEMCQYCKQSMMSINLKNHEENYCPDFPVPCPNHCSQILTRDEVEDHLSSVCTEAELECPFKDYGCLVKDKRGKIQEHENDSLRDHMLLVLDRNSRLEEQISDLYQNLELKENKIQQMADTMKKCEKEFRQFMQLFGTNGNLLPSTQTLASQIDKATRLETQMIQLIQMVSQEQSRLDLKPLMEMMENTKEKIALMETYDHRLVGLECQSSNHDVHINSHKAQLSNNEERFKLLEGACYNGKLIWKITDYKKKKREATEGRVVSIFSQPFYTSRCGYRLCARAYVNGDGSGKGTHLSLYFVVMKGEFDSLLPWPFKQKVTLTLLDQSGKKNHIAEGFRADPNSSSFKRPEVEMNIASGCPRFVSHTTLENGRNTYIKDDTLFIKVTVDLTDLEEL